MLENEKVKESTKTVKMQALQESEAKLEVCSSFLCVVFVSMLGAAIVYRRWLAAARELLNRKRRRRSRSWKRASRTWTKTAQRTRPSARTKTSKLKQSCKASSKKTPSCKRKSPSWPKTRLLAAKRTRRPANRSRESKTKRSRRNSPAFCS